MQVTRVQLGRPIDGRRHAYVVVSGWGTLTILPPRRGDRQWRLHDGWAGREIVRTRTLREAKAAAAYEVEAREVIQALREPGTL